MKPPALWMWLSSALLGNVDKLTGALWRLILTQIILCGGGRWVCWGERGVTGRRLVLVIRLLRKLLVRAATLSVRSLCE